MAKQSNPSSEANADQALHLGRFLDQHRSTILERWAHSVRDLAKARALSTPALIDHIPSLLDLIAQLADRMVAGAPEEFPEREAVAHALQRLDVGSQNFVYGDVDGNIAYFTTGEIPVREDLQTGSVAGAPPWFIRNGRGGNEWVRLAGPLPANQATPRVVLPFSELPKVVNPAAGYLVNANNDPSGVTRNNTPLADSRPGGGIKYMAYGWNRGFRAARIDARLREAEQVRNQAEQSWRQRPFYPDRRRIERIPAGDAGSDHGHRG